MKKLAFFMVLIFVASFSFAQEEETRDREFFNLEITVGVPIHWSNSPTPHSFNGLFHELNRDRTVTTSTSVGLAMVLNFTQKIGFTIDTDFFFGTQLGGQAIGYPSVGPVPISHNNSSTTSNSASLFGFNMLLGPVFYLYNGEHLRIPLALGAHLYYWSSENWASSMNSLWMTARDVQLGPGASLGIQFHFDRNIYILSRTNMAISMYRWHRVEMPGWSYDGMIPQEEMIITHKDSERMFGWHVKPTLGVGIKF